MSRETRQDISLYTIGESWQIQALATPTMTSGISVYPFVIPEAFQTAVFSPRTMLAF